MADTIENIVIAIQAQGADAVVTQLKTMGTVGEATALQIATALAKPGVIAEDLTNKITILTDAILRGVPSIETFAANLEAVTSANLAAAASAIKMAEAETAAATALDASAVAAAESSAALEAHKATVAATATTYSGLKSIIATIGGFFAVNEIKKASDEYTQLSNQLHQVTTSSTDYNNVLAQLTDTANRGQADIGAVVKLYFNLAESTRNLKIPQQDLLTATDAITLGMYQNGVSGAAATRVIKDFSEVLTGAGNTSRLFNSIQQQAPGFLANLADALGVSEAALRKTGSTAKTTTTAAKDYTSILASQRTSVDSASLSLNNLNDKIASGKLTGTALTQAINQQNIAQDRLRAVNDRYAATRDLATAADKKAAVALTNIDPKKLVDALVVLDAQEKNTAATIQGSLSGALTVLNNNFVLLVGRTNETTGTMTLVRNAIILVANNLNIIIPLIAAFGAAWATTKIISGIQAIYAALGPIVTRIVTEIIPSIISIGTTLITETIPAIAATGAAFVAAFPWVFIISLIIIEIGLLLDKLGLLQPLLNLIKQLGTDAWNLLTTGVSNFVQSAIGDFDNLKTGWTNFVDWVEGTTLFQYFKSLIDLINGATNAEKTFNANKASAAPNLYGPGFRDGGAITVPGTGPTDSVPVSFMATPGETISIRTPGQVHAGSFRNGGDIGITDGLNGVNVTFVPSNNNSVTGYQTVALPISIASTASSSSGSGGVSTATTIGSDIATAIASSMSVYGNPPPLLYQRNIDALSYLKKDPNNYQFVSAEAAGLLAQGVSIISVYNTDDAGAIRSGAAFEVANDNAQADYDTQALSYCYVQSQDKNGVAGGPVSWGAVQSALTSRGQYTGPTQQLSADLSKGAIAWNGARFNYEKAENPTYFMRYGLQLGGTTGNAGLGTLARDGLDYTVPGGGAVDSRFLPLNVSPGEHVSVKTPAQQRDSMSAQGTRSVVINNTFHVKDMSDVRASDKQRNQQHAADLFRAARRSGLG